MDFILPGSRPPAKVLNHVPVHLTRYQIAHRQCRYIDYDHTKILTQVLPGNGYAIWVHHVFTEAPVTLECIQEETVMTISYLLLGELSTQGKSIQDHTCWCSESASGQFDFISGHTHVIQIEFFREMIRDAQCMQLPVLFSIATRDILMNILKHDAATGIQELFIDARVRDLLRIYLQQQQEMISVAAHYDPHESLLLTIDQYINAHLDQQLSVPVVAKHFRISRAWLQQLCKRYKQKGFHQWVNEQRMQEAARLLCTTNEPVHTIVMKVSCMQFASFSAAFRQYFQMSPSQYRELYGQSRKR